MPVRVLTLNVWNRSGPWERRRELIGELLASCDADLIGFQEVLVGGGLDQLAEIAPEGFHREYAAAVPWPPGPGVGFGNAICSRWPITAHEEVRLPESGDGEVRVALSVDVESPYGTISFTCTHLNWRLHHGGVRERQVVSLAEMVLRRRVRGGFPSIVVGDFNADPDSAEIRFMRGRQSLDGRSVLFYDAWDYAGAGGPGYTWANENAYARGALEPNRRIDYVFATYPALDGRGVIEACRVVATDPVEGVWPSDHYGVYAELRTDPHPARLELLEIARDL